jgi:hypothetical protein
MWLMNLLEGDEDSGNGLKDHVGQIRLKFMTSLLASYDKINEETGATEYGVLTYLIAPDKHSLCYII